MLGSHTMTSAIFKAWSLETISIEGDSRKSSTSALKAKPKQAIVGFLNLLAFSTIFLMTQSGLESLTSRAVLIKRASSGALSIINQGSTAIQWPPTPGPGCKIFTRGCRFAKAISDQTSIFSLSQISDNSFAKAIFTSRKEFSVSWDSSAVLESVSNTWPLTNSL